MNWILFLNCRCPFILVFHRLMKFPSCFFFYSY